MATLDDIQRILAGHEPEILPPDHGTRAAVALILREGESGLEALFIERAAHEGDPWSGDVGFPGGKVEEEDSDPRRTAERETLEEIGLDLREGRFLGRLSDIAGAHLPVRVACFVYGVRDPAPFALSREIREAFWVPLAELLDQARHVEAPVRFRGEILTRPAIHLPQPARPVLWGLTYRLVMHFLQLLQLEGGAPFDLPWHCGKMGGER